MVEPIGPTSRSSGQGPQEPSRIDTSRMDALLQVPEAEGTVPKKVPDLSSLTPTALPEPRHPARSGNIEGDIQNSLRAHILVNHGRK